MKQTRVTLALTKFNGQWEAALIVDGKFRRSYQGANIGMIAAKAIGPILDAYQQESTEVLFEIGINEPVEKPSGSKN